MFDFKLDKKQLLTEVSIGIFFSLCIFFSGCSIPFTLNLFVVLPISFLSSFINRRLACLAYCIPVLYACNQLAAALGGFENIEHLFRLPFGELILITGVLHMTEGILVMLDGGKESKCIIAYKRNKLAGGYQTYRRWFVPLFLLSLNGFYFPILALIAYKDETFTMVPKSKVILMGKLILIFGIAACLMGYLGLRGMLSLGIIMAIMPFLHEGMFWIDKMIENKDCLYMYPKQGVRIIETREGQRHDGLFNRGDVILAVNHQKIYSIEGYYQEIEKKADRFYIQLRTLEGRKKFIICSRKKMKEEGIILLPEE